MRVHPGSASLLTSRLRLVELRSVGYVQLANFSCAFLLYLCINKWGLLPFSYCKCGAVAQTEDSILSDCHMHCALQRARDRTALDKRIKGCGLVHC